MISCTAKRTSDGYITTDVWHDRTDCGGDTAVVRVTHAFDLSSHHQWGDLAQAKHADETRPHLPGAFRNITDNYNHLFEQPTLFYAVVVYIFLAEHTDSTHVLLAWTFVGFRVAHSLVQVTSNWVPLRIVCFVLSGACLLAMVVREGVALV